VSRPSPITIVLLTLTASVVGIGIYMVARPRHEPEAAAPVAPTEDDAPTPPPEDKVPTQGETAARAALQAVAQAAMAEKTATDENDKAVKTRRLFLSSQRHKIRRSADESAFDVLKLPEAARAAIRRINDESERRDEKSIRNLSTATPLDPQGRSDGHDGAGDAIRQSAIDSVLGPEVASQFTAFEGANVRRLKRRTRGARNRELNEQAPLPPSAAPAAAQ